MAKTTCPHCHNEIHVGIRKCPHCLAELENNSGPIMPSTGKAIGVAILCWFIAGSVCATLTWIGGGTVFGVTIQPSTGGLLSLVLGIICGVRYKSSGEFGASIILAITSGFILAIVVIGVWALLLSQGIYR